MSKVVFLLVPRVHLLDLAGPAQAFGTAAGLGRGYELSYVAEQEDVPTAQGLTVRAATDWPALTTADFPQIAQESFSRRRPRVETGHRVPSIATGGVLLYTPEGHLRPLEDIEGDVIRLAISHYRGRMSEVARRLGIGRSTLYRKLGDLGIDSAA